MYIDIIFSARNTHLSWVIGIHIYLVIVIGIQIFLSQYYPSSNTNEYTSLANANSWCFFGK